MPEKPEHRWGIIGGERRTPGRRQWTRATGEHRWGIAVLIGAAIAISYFDRQTLPVAINAIEREIPISNTQFSQLQAAFLTAYAIMYAGGGRLIDVLGVRAGFALIMAWWSLASASHALATGFRPHAATPL